MTESELIEQAKQLVEDFPPYSKVHIKNENKTGTVVGYQPCSRTKDGTQMALRLRVPNDTWIMYRDQVKKETQ